ncbi:hypothetical protein TZ05_2485 [Listeria monocytogenes]|nr:hypothetical protein X846_2147 [Listeria monocytogenes Lm_1886]KKO41284.1 hypothetical protein TZ05_2485 [Listeria monocytogenes]
MRDKLHAYRPSMEKNDQILLLAYSSKPSKKKSFYTLEKGC